jgi:hypothetical protein
MIFSMSCPKEGIVKSVHMISSLNFIKWLAGNVWLFAVAGMGGFKNGAQRNVKADLL